MRAKQRLEKTVEAVRARYARIARGQEPGCCGAAEPEAARRIGYDERDLTAAPQASNLGLGCGAPVGLLDLGPGETVLDLGSGAGLDAILAARAVGPSGRVIGVDMTDEMIARARASAAEAGWNQIEFRKGRLESLPVEDNAIDAITSNCVINLVPDKAAVFREAARVLRPGGRIVVSDIVLDGALPEVVSSDMMAYVGCISGAMQREEYLALVEAAGLSRIAILKDIDFLEAAGFALPSELVPRMQAAGVTVADLEGKIRSITFRAVKPN